MKIVVFSDSHGDTVTMDTVIGPEQPDLVLHLGDHLRDARSLSARHPGLPLELVRGNTDAAPDLPFETLLTVRSLRIFMTHGHLYDVESDAEMVIGAGMAEHADIILFGHTHRAFLKRRGSVWIMNPGRIGRISRKKIDATYGIIEIENGEAACGIARPEKEG